MERIQKFISFLEGGALADALMTLVVAYEGQEARIERLKERIARSVQEHHERT
jgi:hypothetical protein